MCGFVGLGVHAGGVCVFSVVGGCYLRVHTCVCVLMCGFVGLGVHAGGVCVFSMVGGCVIPSLYVRLFGKL